MNLYKLLEEIEQVNLKDKIIRFFKENPNPNQEKVELFCKENDLDINTVRDIINSLLFKYISSEKVEDGSSGSTGANTPSIGSVNVGWANAPGSGDPSAGWIASAPRVPFGVLGIDGFKPSPKYPMVRRRRRIRCNNK